MPADIDSLLDIERIEFNDQSVALDISGAAGQVAKILGSVFGQSYVSNTVFAGIGFAYLDGGMSYLDLCGLAAGAAGLTTPDLLVTTLLRNTTGTEPTALSKSSYLQSISSGASYASIVQKIADASANAQSIKLTTLATTGLPYTPFVIPASPTYKLTANATSVNEGELARVFVNTSNVAPGTNLEYGISGVGITSSDVIGGLKGVVSVDTSGQAIINLLISADQTTEGPETVYVTLGTSTTSFIINDTSVTLIGVVDSGGGDGGGSGGGGGAGGD